MGRQRDTEAQEGTTEANETHTSPWDQTGCGRLTTESLRLKKTSKITPYHHHPLNCEKQSCVFAVEMTPRCPSAPRPTLP